MGRGNILWKHNDLGMCRGNTNNGTREPHPVWGFKNLKAERCGAKGLGRRVDGRRKLSIVFKRSLQAGCSRKVALRIEMWIHVSEYMLCVLVRGLVDWRCTFLWHTNSCNKSFQSILYPARTLQEKFHAVFFHPFFIAVSIKHKMTHSICVSSDPQVTHEKSDPRGAPNSPAQKLPTSVGHFFGSHFPERSQQTNKLCKKSSSFFTLQSFLTGRDRKGLQKSLTIFSGFSHQLSRNLVNFLTIWSPSLQTPNRLATMFCHCCSEGSSRQGCQIMKC